MRPLLISLLVLVGCGTSAMDDGGPQLLDGGPLFTGGGGGGITGGGAGGGGGTVDAGPIDAGPPPHVKLATLNLKLFFDTVCQSGMCAAADFEQAPTQAQFDARATIIANAISAMNVDLIALEEVETQTCLDALLSRLSTQLPYGSLGETGAPGSVDVAILSKWPIDATLPHRLQVQLVRPDGSLTSFTRELLEVDVHLPGGQPVFLFAAHFRSKVQDDPGRRFAEAVATRRIMEQRAAERPDALIVLGGDLNDTPGSDPLNALMLDGGLTRVAADLPTASQYTYYSGSRGEAIDHLLQAHTSLGVPVPMSAKVWRTAQGYAGSDHCGLSAEFVLSPR